ncbi:MAG: TonB-dependent receptor [Prevotellaceae bacterium]|jgi:TonB-linked SusC/RagA family outer membrane protein|nr:TonB-dependent receptor [Prevotellaceae bacterium]
MKKIILQMLLVIASIGFAQAQTRITGKIADAEGKPLDVVSISVKEVPTAGTLTDAGGNYTLNVPSGGLTLVFSYIGYVTQEVAIGSRSIIDITLESDATTLEESVSIGYMTIKKSSFTGAATVVKSDKIEKLPMPSVDQALQGQVPGLQTSTGTGQPGADTKMTIRGISSITAGTNPLYIIDGIPVTIGNVVGDAGGTTYDELNGSLVSAMADINPNDIESVNVLKDASATSIYGARAANGVIVITTKQGRQGKTKFNFSSQAGVSSRTNTGFRMLNSDEWIELAHETYINSGLSEDDFYGTTGFMARFPKTPDGKYYNTDWTKESYRDNALTYQVDFSAQGGNEKTTFFFSIGRFSQDAILRWGNFTRNSGRLNLTHQGTKWLKFGANVTYSYSFRDIPPVAGSAFASPVLGALMSNPLDPVYLETGEFNTSVIGNSGTNYVATNTYNYTETRTNRFIGTIFAELTFVKNLKFKTQYGYDFSNNMFDEWIGADAPGYNDTYQESAYRYATNDFVQNLTNTLVYNFTLKNVHNFNLLAGQETTQSDYRDVHLWTGDFPEDTKLREPGIGTAPLYMGGTKGMNRLFSLFAQFNYDYDNKYYLSASIRRDGSSKFGINNRYATFWSLGLSWNMKREKFLEQYDWLNQLTIRASHGTNGNSDIGNYRSKNLYAYDAYNSLPASYPYQWGLSSLTWETVASSNVGLDFRVLNNRVGGTIEVYYKKTTDMLLSVPVSYTLGTSTLLQNAGSMRNQGIELSINAVPVKTKDFTWIIDANWSRNLNKVLDLKSEGLPYYYNSRIRIEAGRDVRSFYMVKSAGVNPADGNRMWYNKDGELVFHYTDDNRVFGLGSASPDGSGGITNTFSYKGFTLSAFFFFQYGNKIFLNEGRYTMDLGGNLSYGIMATQLDRWQKPGDITSVPKLLRSNTANPNDSYYLYDGSYIRLRNITLSYDLPEKWVTKIGLTGLRIFAQGQNLLTITKYPGQDPEVSDGQAFFAYPAYRTWTLGLDVKF